MISARSRVQARQLGAIVVLASVLTPVFNVVTSRPALDEAVQGLVDAIVITLLVGGFTLFVRDGALRSWFGRLPFVTDIAVSSAITLALFLLGRAAGKLVTTRDPHRFVTSFADPHLVYALPFFLILAVGVHLVRQTSRMIGANVLRYFVTGVYHRPAPEERIFLFLDIEGSTSLAERLGSATYFELLRRFVDDLSEPILAAEGEIYQYAGDEVVVTWPMDRGTRAANCVRCFFAIRDAIGRAADGYRRDFGTVPRFHAGLHGGPVTAGELGDLRRQIVFVGDVLNTAARLEEHAKRAGLDLVVSGALLERLALPPGVAVEAGGEMELRGKTERVAVFGLSAE